MIKWNLRTKYTNLLSVLKNQSNALSNFKPSDPAIFKSDTDNLYTIALFLTEGILLSVEKTNIYFKKF